MSSLELRDEGLRHLSNRLAVNMTTRQVLGSGVQAFGSHCVRRNVKERWRVHDSCLLSPPLLVSIRFQ